MVVRLGIACVKVLRNGVPAVEIVLSGTYHNQMQRDLARSNRHGDNVLLPTIFHIKQAPAVRNYVN